MAATQNYSLPLPQLGEPADIRVLDQGTEMIDGIMHGNRTMVAPAWVSTETYNTGNRVVYLGEYYKCKEDGVTGTWDATKWDKTTVGEDIEGLGTGGASALADLDDVAITSPTDGQALLYDDSDDKWKNGTLPDPSVTKTATGNPIEITDAAAAPMVKCVTEIQGSQDLHGYDKPWVGGAGKNKLPMTVDGIKALNTSGTWTGNVYAIANTTFTIETDNGGNVISIVVNGTTDSDFQQLEIPISNSLFGTEIILSKGYNLNDVVVGVTQNGSTKIICLTTEVAGTIPDTGTISCYVRLVANRSANNVKIYPMIRLSTVADSTFEPYSNICPITAYTEGEIEVSDGDGNTTTHTTTFPSAIYRGSEDVVNGEVSGEWVCVDLGDFNYILATNFQADMPLTGTGSGYTDCICEQYIMHNIAGASMVIGDIKIQDRFLYICDTRYNDATAFKSAMTGIKLVYKLSSPTTSSVTPTNLPIKSLSGYNHIESSTGEMEVEYISGNYQALVDLIQSNQHVYSTGGQVVGKWIDGSDLYEKTIVIQNFSASTQDSGWYYGTVNLSDYSITPSQVFPRGSETFITLQDTTTRPSVFIDWQGGSSVYVYFLGSRIGTLTLTIRYTKSSNNRSLTRSIAPTSEEPEANMENEDPEINTEEEEEQR